MKVNAERNSYTCCREGLSSGLYFRFGFIRLSERIVAYGQAQMCFGSDEPNRAALKRGLVHLDRILAAPVDPHNPAKVRTGHFNAKPLAPETILRRLRYVRGQIDVRTKAGGHA